MQPNHATERNRRIVAALLILGLLARIPLLGGLLGLLVLLVDWEPFFIPADCGQHVPLPIFATRDWYPADHCSFGAFGGGGRHRAKYHAGSACEPAPSPIGFAVVKTT